MKNENNQASLSNIARLAGVSPTAASYALRNKPGVSQAMRKRILRLAKQLGYTPDPRINNWMAQVRGAKSKELLPIAWINTADDRMAWHRLSYHRPFIEGARSRALELGYQIEEFWRWDPGITMRKLGQILYQRGIEGAIITFPAKHFRLDWKYLASVALGATLLVPRLHRITSDLYFNLGLALKAVRRLGYERIGICLTGDIDFPLFSGVRAIARDIYYRMPKKAQIPPLFHPFLSRKGYDQETKLLTWAKRYRPEVIVCHDNRMVRWLEKAGFRVPEEIGVVHLAVDDDVLDWAGVHSKRREIGARAADLVISMIRNREFGPPETPTNVMISGVWQMGRTLKALPDAICTRGVKDRNALRRLEA